MQINRKPIFDAVRTLRTGQPFTQAEVNLLDAAIDVAIAPLAVAVPMAVDHPAPKVQPVFPPTFTAPSTQDDSGFRLSKASLAELAPVLPSLRKVIELSIKYSLVDFKVGQGERTLEEQRDAFRRGTTRTMKSKHLMQPNGFVLAVDLWALKNGQVSWDFEQYYYIARAVDKAATELKCASNIRWGCVWDRVLSDFGTDNPDKAAIRKAYLDAIEEYKRRHPGKDFLDGPHFEWVP